MTRSEVVTQLRAFMRNFQIDLFDAKEILDRIPDEEIDSETFGDYLDGAGYPELATVVYESEENHA